MNKLLVSKSGFELQEIELVHGSVSIGRAKDNDVQLNDATVSSHHAKIVTVMSTSYIQDLGSTNGVYVNGKPVVVQALHPDDVIAIGKHELLYHQEGANESSQDENVYDSHVMKSLARAGTAGSHEPPAMKDKPFTDFRGTINFSDADISEIGQADHGIRVVVDNTNAKAADVVSKRSLDIDVNFDKFLDDKPGNDVMPKVSDIPGGVKVQSSPETNEDSKFSSATNPYMDYPPPVSNPMDTPVEADSQHEADQYPNHNYIHNDGKELPDPVQTNVAKAATPNETLHQKTDTMNQNTGAVSTSATSTARMQSKQPFISSEEVVEQLIQMGRDKAKRSKKSSSLSSIIGVITFLAILVAVYFQLQ